MSEEVTHASVMRRRTFLGLAGALLLCAAASPIRAVRAEPSVWQGARSLLTAHLELAGDWKSSPPEAVKRVLGRTREACLFGLKLYSDRQPERLRVESREGGPAIWLHKENANLAWVVVSVGPLDWSRLAYQFGHELGHVFCNSWDPGAKPRAPSQWLEEAMVEAFSIRGLGLLAASWEQDPPFAGNARFGAAIRQYRANVVEKYKKAADEAPGPDVAAWFQARRSSIKGGLSVALGPAVLAILAELERDKSCVEDLGAVNRWAARGGVPVEDYLALWENSCKEVGAPGQLPARMKTLFGLG